MRQEHFALVRGLDVGRLRAPCPRAAPQVKQHIQHLQRFQAGVPRNRARYRLTIPRGAGFGKFRAGLETRDQAYRATGDNNEFGFTT